MGKNVEIIRLHVTIGFEVRRLNLCVSIFNNYCHFVYQ